MRAAGVVLAIVGGTGALGSGLARRWAAAGYGIVLGSRIAEKAEAAARRLDMPPGLPPARGASNAEAAKAGDVVVLTVPWSSHAQVLAAIEPHVAGKLVIDATVPLMPPKVSVVRMPAEGCAALATQSRLGTEARVVAAFHNVAAHKLQSGAPIDCDVLIFGDDATDRETVREMCAALGLRGIHAGPLANAVAAEALTAVLIGINRTYKIAGAGVRITGIGTDESSE